MGVQLINECVCESVLNRYDHVYICMGASIHVYVCVCEIIFNHQFGLFSTLTSNSRDTNSIKILL